ncbi:MAG: hypothetical protein R2713_17605 [Ilumatobacteraceae bacterium]
MIKHRLIEAFHPPRTATRPPARAAARPAVPRHQPRPQPGSTSCRTSLVERICTDTDIDTAVDVPPQTAKRGCEAREFIKKAKERKRDYTVDWVHLKLNDQAQRTVLCKDPFKSRRTGPKNSSPRSDGRIPSHRSVRSEWRTSSWRAGDCKARPPRRRQPGVRADRAGGRRLGGRRGRGEHHRRRSRPRHRQLARRLEPDTAASCTSQAPATSVKVRYQASRPTPARPRNTWHPTTCRRGAALAG